MEGGWGNIKMNCVCMNIKTPGVFNSFSDYEAHKKELINSGLFVAVPVAQPYANVGGLEEAWYKCKHCNCLWRLVEPDPPFKGIWQQVDQ